MGATIMTTTEMTLDGYQTAATDTAIYPGQGNHLGLIYTTLKGEGEGGEFAEKLGKAMRDDALINIIGEVGADQTPDGERHYVVSMRALSPERREALALELGDALWYISQKAKELGYTLSEVAGKNLIKLRDRKARNVLGGSGDNR